ncbi:Putative DNA excision repair protein ERCC-1 [Gryllus bimaculatus]|nr:Putative DNA excision repair protein ERCC-1 [Gryllus bimaculatus]
MDGTSDESNSRTPKKANEAVEEPENFSNLADALGGLKKSKFYEKVTFPDSSKPGSSKLLRSGSAKFNPVLVSPKQRGNPLLKHISNVPWEFEEISPDYVMGRTTCALFLSLRYHNLNPDYIHERLKLLGQEYELRVLLIQVDTSDPHHPLKYLTRVSLLANLTLMLAWSPQEAGQIIETYKIYEHKPPDMIMEKTEASSYQKLISALTTIRSINRTDAATLLSSFGSLKKILSTSQDVLSLCPGVGPKKASQLYKVLHQPFLKETKRL